MAKTEAPDKLEYRVKRGDTLTSILQAFYSTGPRDADWQLRLAQVMALNPHIKHPDMIRAGSLLHLSAGPAGAAAVPVPAPMALPNTAPAWQATAPSTLLTWLASQRDLALNPGSAMFGASEALLSGGNIDLIRDISTR